MNRSPLIVHLGHMGDMVILLTLIRALHLRFGAPVDVVCCGGWAEPLLASQPAVGTLYRIRSRKDAYWMNPQQWQVVRALRRREPGPTWICDEVKVSKGRQLVRKAGIPESLILDRRTFPFIAGEHLADTWWRFAQMTPPALLNVPRTEDRGVLSGPAPVPSLVINPQWRTQLDQWLAQRGWANRPLLLFQVGSKCTMRRYRPYQRASNRKYWPVEHWAQAIDGIAEIESGAEILLLGVPSEAPINDAILKLVRTPRAHNVASEVPMQRLLALQERALGMVSVDTGPAHSAAALGCPLVVLFGMEDPSMWQPRSTSGLIRLLAGSVDGRRSMLGIQPGQVVTAWEQLVEERSSVAATPAQSAVATTHTGAQSPLSRVQPGNSARSR